MDPNKIENLIDHYTKQIASGISHYGPKAWEVLLQVRQAECFANILIGFVMLVFGAVLGYVLIRTTMWAAKKSNDVADDAEASGYCVLATFSGVFVLLSAAAVINGITYIADPWAWIGMYHPQIAVAHDIIQKALGS